jgi:hypothetical protein
MKAKWAITADKFLTMPQVDQLLAFPQNDRDLAIARQNTIQPIKNYYMVRALLEVVLGCLSFVI